MLYTFQNTIINFAVTRCQYFLILFLGLSWLFTDKQSTAAFQASVWFYSSDKSSVSSYVSQSRSGKQTVKPLHSSLLPFAAQRVRSVRGKHVHNLCCAGQWLCVTCAWDSEGCALVRSVCEAGAWVVPGGFPRAQWTCSCTYLWAVIFWKHWLGVMAIFMPEW